VFLKCIVVCYVCIEPAEGPEPLKEENVMKAATKEGVKTPQVVYRGKSVSSLKRGGLIKRKIQEWKDTFLIRGAARA
jgi:hypothetical protein